MNERSRERASALPPGPSSEPEPPGGAGAQAERSGPLALERLRKADGRRLILYTGVAADG